MKRAIVLERDAKTERNELAQYVEVVEDIGDGDTITSANHLHDEHHANDVDVGDDAGEEVETSVEKLLDVLWYEYNGSEWGEVGKKSGEDACEAANGDEHETGQFTAKTLDDIYNLYI